MNKPFQNSPCPCGSGKKYKRCCGSTLSAPSRAANDKGAARQLIETALRFHQSGDLQGAARLYDQVLAKHPGDSGVLGMRGMVAFEQKEYDEARTWLDRAIKINPDDSRLHNFMGQLLAAEGELIGAERSFAKAVTLDPEFFEGWCNLAVTLKQGHQLMEAIPAFERALKLSPNDGELYVELTEVHYLLGDLDAAERDARKALALGVRKEKAGMWLSLALRAKGEIEASQTIESESFAVAVIPADIYGLLVKFGRIDVLVGNLAQAEYWLARAMQVMPEDPFPYIELAESKKFKEADRGFVQKMESFAADEQRYSRKLEFALGKVFTDLGDYSASFEHYRKANEIARKTVPFDAARIVDAVDMKIATFTQDFMATLPRGSDSALPILIVGTPRSGTTLTEQIVSSHSKVAGAGELGFWGRLGRSIESDMPHRYNKKVAVTLANGYLNLLRTYSAGAERVTDKMPGNFSHVGLIHAVFPNAKIIHCRRHPIDACLSMYFQNFNDDHGYKFSLEGLVVFYEQYLRLMAHWRSVLPPGVMYEIQYEDLVEDTEGESRKLMEFLELEWEEGQMDFFKKARPVFTCSKWQVRQPIYKSSKDRWKRYENFIEPLLPLLKYTNATP